MILMARNESLYTLIACMNICCRQKTRRKKSNLSNFYENSSFFVSTDVASYIIINFEPLKSMKQNFWLLHSHKFYEYKSKYFHTECVCMFFFTQKSFSVDPPKSHWFRSIFCWAYFAKSFWNFFMRARSIKVCLDICEPKSLVFLRIIPSFRFDTVWEPITLLKKITHQSFAMEMRFAKRKTFSSFFSLCSDNEQKSFRSLIRQQEINFLRPNVFP